MTLAPEGTTSRRPGTGFLAWMVLAVCAFVGFILLGNWQLHRLDWKLQLIHDVTTRIHAPPVPAPGPDAWPGIKNGQLQYLHVQLEGHFLEGKQTLVHGTSPKGYGYWVMAPFKSSSGFIVLVNRGYIPPELVDASGKATTKAPANNITLTGLLRFTEPDGGFLRANRPDTGQWYSRDVDAILETQNLDPASAAPYFVDADADAAQQGWPLGGQTTTHFRNTHLGYAITWYLMALAVLLAAGLTIRHEKQKRTDHYPASGKQI